MTVPLVVRRRALGAITFVAAESRRRYGEDDLAIALDLARRAATAVDNALLYREALIKESQVRFLAEAGSVLSEQLDYDETLAAIARLAVPRIADWCIVDVVDGAEIRRVAVAADDEEKQAALDELREHYPPTWDSPQPAARALRDGAPVIFKKFEGERLEETVVDERHLRDHADARSPFRRRDAARRARREGRRDHVCVVGDAASLQRARPALDGGPRDARGARGRQRASVRARARDRRPACVPRRDELGARVLARLRDDARERRAADRPAVRRLVRGRHRRRGRHDRAHRGRPQGRRRSSSGRAVRATCIRPTRPSRRAPRASSGRARPCSTAASRTSSSSRPRRGPENLEVLRELGMASAMVVPMKARGRTLGALMLVSSNPKRLYDDDALTFAEHLGPPRRRPRSTTRYLTAARSSARRRRGRSPSSRTACCSSTRTGSSASGTRRPR